MWWRWSSPPNRSPTTSHPSSSPSAPERCARPRPELTPPRSPLAGQPVVFVGSFPDPRHPLDPDLPEIAFLGRSNVGKSSLLNALVGRRIARTSSTPGKTQYLNVFRLPGLYLLDLPGYGFARVSKSERARFRKLVEGVVGRRDRLAAVVWLLDIRHRPSADDIELKSLLEASGRPIYVVLTKADKLPYGQRQRAVARRGGELGLAPDELLAVSGTTDLGVATLGRALLDAVGAG